MTLGSHQSSLAAKHLPLGEFERGLLAISRNLFLSFAEPGGQSWQIAFKIAEERLGETLGLSAAHLTVKLVRAILRSRTIPFEFTDPVDADQRSVVTYDEVCLMSMIHHKRRDQTAPARAALEELTNGHMDPEVIRAGLGLASRFSKGASVDTRPRNKPRLTIVS